MEEIKVDNLARLYAILLLHEKPEHGYNILKSIRENLGKNASPGQIYPFLKKLQKLGYLKIEKSTGRDKKVYALTKKGKLFSRSLVERLGAIISMAVENKLKKCAHCGCEVYRGGISAAGKAFCCTSCARAFRMQRH